RIIHEINPSRQRGFSTRQPELLVVVKTDPHDAHEVRRIPDKPTIARRAGLSRYRGAANSTTSFTRSAALNYALQHVCNHVSRRRTDNLVRGGRSRVRR